MFVAVQFPVADLRPFVGAETGRLATPPWPLVDPERHFVRSIGAAHDRPRGGVREWPGEGAYCDARKALRFDRGFERGPGLPGGVRVESMFRRLFVTGHPSWAGALARFDAGFQVGPRDTRRYRKYTDLDPVDVAAALLRTPVRVPDPAILMSAGYGLAHAYLRATTAIASPAAPASLRTAFSPAAPASLPAAPASLPAAPASLPAAPASLPAAPASWPAAFSPAAVEPWWVQAGRPLVVVERLTPPGVYYLLGPAVARHSFATFQAGRRRIPVWILDYMPWADRAAVRRLRIHLWRLHQEREVLRLVLAACIAQQLDPAGNTALRDYLARQSDRLRRTRFGGLPQRDLLAYASEVDALVNEADLATLRELLDAFGPGLKHSVLDLARNAEPAPGRAVNIIYMESGTMTVHDNSQNISGNATVGAAIGGSASVTGSTFHQTNADWNQLAGTLDLTALATELTRLRENLRATATEPSHDVVIAEVAQAQIAADSGDRVKLRDHLSRTGKWALTAATAIGTTVAAAAIKAATGL